MINVVGFSKCYEQFLAVDNLSFTIAPGHVLGLVGRNGAGKTTTLRSINGIIPPSQGLIEVDGYSIESNPIELKQRTAYVPDDPQLFEDLTVEQHLRFQASVYQIFEPADEISRMLEMFELDAKRHNAASSLSRGMRQKLAICCAYLQQPKALLLDEPMTGLDPQGIRVLKQSIKEQAERGAAVIISSHLLAMVEDICSHVLVLDCGKEKFLGDLATLQEQFSSGKNKDNRSLEQAFFSALEGAQDAVGSELSLGVESIGNASAAISASAAE